MAFILGGEYMEYEKVTPEQHDWQIQINVTAYYGQHTIGAIVYLGKDRGWECIIGGKLDYMEAETEEEAKIEMISKLESYFESEINYYRELTEMLKDFKL